MENNCKISTSDPVVYILYDVQETKDLFGEDYLEEMGSYVPEELIQLYKKNMAEFKYIQELIRIIKHGTR